MANASRWFGNQVSSAPLVSTAPGTVKSKVSVKATTPVRQMRAAANHPRRPQAMKRARSCSLVGPRRSRICPVAQNHIGTNA